jgi:hypothetical protein
MSRQVAIGTVGLLVCVGLALAQDANKQSATVKLVDPDKGKMLVTLMDKDGGIKVVEYDIAKDVKFLDEKGKPLKDDKGKPITGKDALKLDRFKSDNNRPAVPISIAFNKDGSMKSIQFTPPK